MTKKSLTLFISLFCLSGLALADAYQVGEHYRVAEREQRLSDKPGEVVEFFWYGCGGCFAFLPAVEQWKAELPDDVAFKRVPAVLNPRWRVHGQAYYTAEALGMVDEIHQAMFDAMHVEGRRLNSQSALRDFFVEHGADPEEFDAAFDSFQVDARLRRAANLSRRFQVRATPSIVVNGRYVTDLNSAGGPDGLVNLGSWLLHKDD